MIVGITPTSHRNVGQELTDEGLRHVAALLRHFEPAVAVEQERVPVDDAKALLVLTVTPVEEHEPYVCTGVPGTAASARRPR